MSPAMAPASRHTEFQKANKLTKLDFGRQLDRLGTASRFCENAQVYGEGDPADYLYKVISGVVRSYKLTTEGKLTPVGFQVRGDLFGFEAHKTHTLSAEAITTVKVRVFRRSVLNIEGARDKRVAQQLSLGIYRQTERHERHIIQMSMRAEERVKMFLSELATRLETEDELNLPILWQHVADYLCIQTATLSRVLRRLERNKATLRLGPYALRLNFKTHSSASRRSHQGVSADGKANPVSH